METLYHGTRAGFSVGGYLFPPARAGYKMRDDLVLPEGWVDDRHLWVYATPNIELAWAYADSAPGLGKPKVLVVQMFGQLEVDQHTVNGEWLEAYRAEWAKVIKVIKEDCYV